METGVGALDKSGFCQSLGARQGTGNIRASMTRLDTMEVRLSVGRQRPSKRKASKAELALVAVVSQTFTHSLRDTSSTGCREDHSIREHGS